MCFEMTSNQFGSLHPYARSLPNEPLVPSSVLIMCGKVLVAMAMAIKSVWMVGTMKPHIVYIRSCNQV